MAGLITSLESQGARFTFHGQPGHFPFTMHTSGLRGGTWRVDASASSQMLSALMMVAPCTDAPVTIEASGARPAFVQMTASLMNRFGVDIHGSPDRGYSIPRPQAYASPSGAYAIEPDVTAASYFMVLPYVVGGSLKINGLHDDMLQGDLAFAGVLREFGMNIEQDIQGWTVSFPDVPVPHPASFSKFSDTFLTFAAIAPLFPGPVIIEGIGHTRFQECNRISAAANGLQRAGARVSEEQTALSIWPFSNVNEPPASDTVIDSCRDHRVAMSFAILGCRNRRSSGEPWLHIADPACTGKTFPGFFQELQKLYRYSHDVRN
jgi:3-phosphoshikimate 1-carboxyvinyltransferase